MHVLKLDLDPTPSFQDRVIKAIKASPSFIPENKRFLYRVMNPNVPVLYALPKLHKPDCPLRPIVSYINAPAVNICKLINDVLPNIINFRSTYSIKNTLHLIEDLDNFELPSNATLVSFDVKSLFTSVPVQELKTILRNRILSCSIPLIKITELLDLISICLEQNYFKFDDTIFHQLEGLPM
jgi:hypothetical protein